MAPPCPYVPEVSEIPFSEVILSDHTDNDIDLAFHNITFMNSPEQSAASGSVFGSELLEPLFSDYLSVDDNNRIAGISSSIPSMGQGTLFNPNAPAFLPKQVISHHILSLDAPIFILINKITKILIL